MYGYKFYQENIYILEKQDGFALRAKFDILVFMKKIILFKFLLGLFGCGGDYFKRLVLFILNCNYIIKRI